MPPQSLRRPRLNPVTLENPFVPGCFTITFSIGQWDLFLQTAYDRGAILLELDDNEKLVATYRKDDFCNETDSQAG